MIFKNEKIYNLIHSDESIIVLSKEHGVHCIPDRYGESGVTVSEALATEFGKIYTVHRLDAGTGGIMVFARNAQAHKKLCVQFEKRVVNKRYLAIISGILPAQTVMLPIAFANHGKHKVNFKSGKDAVTTFTPISTNGRQSIISAQPSTGRTHQIRVHLKACKTPLFQDWLYNDKISDRRLTLFAESLSFHHPLNEARMSFTAPVSDFMLNISNSLGLSIKNMVSVIYEDN